MSGKSYSPDVAENLRQAVAYGTDECGILVQSTPTGEEARAARRPLIVSRLDGLSRNVHFITGLMEHKQKRRNE